MCTHAYGDQSTNHHHSMPLFQCSTLSSLSSSPSCCEPLWMDNQFGPRQWERASERMHRVFDCESTRELIYTFFWHCIATCSVLHINSICVHHSNGDHLFSLHTITGPNGINRARSRWNHPTGLIALHCPGAPFPVRSPCIISLVWH